MGEQKESKSAMLDGYFFFFFLNEGTKWENGGGELLEHEGEKKMAGWRVEWLTGSLQCRHLRRLLLNGCLSEQQQLPSVPLL